MISVISYTNDYKMYYYCSEEVKKDYEFVKYIVYNFKNNTDFVIQVANHYFNNSNNELERIELSIIMEKILPKDLSNNYKEINETNYYMKRVEIEIAELKEPKLKKMIDMGYWLIFDQYNESNIILDYYAKTMIDEIIRDNNINFEKMLHSQFKSVTDINKLGINNYIISFIGYYDSLLSSYVSTNIEIIKPIVNIIKTIQNNWDNYLSIDETKRYNNMLNMVHEYIVLSNSNIEENEILYYVAKELNIIEKVKQYDGTKEIEENFKEEYGFDLNDDCDETISNDLIRFEIEKNIKEKLIYLNVKKIIINQLFSDKPLDLYSLIKVKEIKSNKKTKCKIIKMNPNNKTID